MKYYKTNHSVAQGYQKEEWIGSKVHFSFQMDESEFHTLQTICENEGVSMSHLMRSFTRYGMQTYMRSVAEAVQAVKPPVKSAPDLPRVAKIHVPTNYPKATPALIRRVRAAHDPQRSVG